MTEEKSVSAQVGHCSSMLIIAGTKPMRVARSASIILSAVAGSKAGSSTRRAPPASTASAGLAPPTWNRGITWIMVSWVSKSSPSKVMAVSRNAAMLALESRTPLGRPVVPEV